MWPGWRKARLVEDVLRDRVRDEARGLSGAREPHRLLDRARGSRRPSPGRACRAPPRPRSPTGATGSARRKTSAASAIVARSTGTASPRRAAVRRMKSGSPRRQKGRPISSRRSQALSVISGPMPAGSPCVRARIAAPAPLPRRRDGSVIRRGHRADVLLDVRLAERAQLEPHQHRLDALLLAVAQRDLARARRIADRRRSCTRPCTAGSARSRSGCSRSAGDRPGSSAATPAPRRRARRCNWHRPP